MKRVLQVTKVNESPLEYEVQTRNADGSIDTNRTSNVSMGFNIDLPKLPCTPYCSFEIDLTPNRAFDLTSTVYNSEVVGQFKNGINPQGCVCLDISDGESIDKSL